MKVEFICTKHEHKFFLATPVELLPSIQVGDYVSAKVTYYKLPTDPSKPYPIEKTCELVNVKVIDRILYLTDLLTSLTMQLLIKDCNNEVS